MAGSDLKESGLEKQEPAGTELARRSIAPPDPGVLMKAHRLVLSIALLSGVIGAGAASAQSFSPGAEIGGQATLLKLSGFDSTSVGTGGRFAFNFSRWAAAEAEVNFYPREEAVLPMATSPVIARVAYHRRRVDAVFGVKLGHRSERFGVFGKVRPGFARLSDKGVECVGEVCAFALLALPEYRTEFALDVGGILEVYPSSRTIARIDLGDLMVSHRSLAPPCQDCTSHNFTSRFGVGYRF
jgi:hypothetical protein